MPVVRVETDRHRIDAFAVRRAVFVEEQAIPESLEFDDKDAEAVQFVAYDDGEPVGTARLRERESRDDFASSVGKVERVAVYESRRGEGWGHRLLDEIDVVARGRYDELYLHARLDAVDFYERHGYEREGDPFEEVEIPHISMRKPLEPERSG